MRFVGHGGIRLGLHAVNTHLSRLELDVGLDLAVLGEGVDPVLGPLVLGSVAWVGRLGRRSPVWAVVGVSASAGGWPGVVTGNHRPAPVECGDPCSGVQIHELADTNHWEVGGRLGLRFQLRRWREQRRGTRR